MEKKKNIIPKIFIVVLIGLILVCVGGLCLKAHRKHQEEYEARLAKLYKEETYAMGMEQSTYYKDFGAVYINVLTLELASYRDKNPGVNISIDDIQDFLSEEFDDRGKPRVLNPPDNIADYIKWFNHGGRQYTDEYILYLMHYMNDHQDEYTHVDLYYADLETLNKIIEEFNNCPDRSKYEYY